MEAALGGAETKQKQVSGSVTLACEWVKDEAGEAAALTERRVRTTAHPTLPVAPVTRRTGTEGAVVVCGMTVAVG